MSEEILARVGASVPRRWFALAVVMALGGVLLYLALTAPPQNPLWLLFLVGLGLGTLWLGVLMWKATAQDILLTDAGLFASDGTVLARMEDIASVDRSMFAMKPSNGFMVKLRAPGPRAWRPGLWWRLGRRLAVGGVTASSETKPMADILSLKLRGEI